MKKWKLSLTVVCISLLLFGCSTKNTNTNEVSEKLPDVMNQVYKGLDVPSMQQTEVTKENATYFLGVDSLDFEEALASEPMISSIAHSVVLVKMKDGADIENAKQQIKDNIDPRKWICVEVEKDNVLVENKGNLIILIMDNEVSQDILKNFNAL